jgi:hypothetical protein
MSFSSQALRPIRYDRTITYQLMESQTTMNFDEIRLYQHSRLSGTLTWYKHGRAAHNHLK